MKEKTRIDFPKTLLVVALALFLGPAAVYASPMDQPQIPQTQGAAALKEEVRHQLVTLPYYSLFDWLEAEVAPDGQVTLMGEVTHPTLRRDAEASIKRLSAVTKVVDNIEVLPLSKYDWQLRRTLYKAIYKYDSPLFKYALQAVPPIHIIVKNGHVTLKGVVASNADKQLAGSAARGVPFAFDVKNDLTVETVAAPIS